MRKEKKNQSENGAEYFPEESCCNAEGKHKLYTA